MGRRAWVRWAFIGILFAGVLGTGCSAPGQASEAPGNLLKNWSFEVWPESGPSGWVVLQSHLSEHLQNDGQAFHGSYSALVSCRLPQEFVFLRQVVPVEKPGLYRAQLQVRPIMPLTDCFLVVECLDAAGKRIRTPEMRPIRGELDQWRTVSCMLEAPSGTVAVGYEIRIGPNAAGEVGVDAARLERMGEGAK